MQCEVMRAGVYALFAKHTGERKAFLAIKYTAAAAAAAATAANKKNKRSERVILLNLFRVDQ
jgi:hypothetical protein